MSKKNSSSKKSEKEIIQEKSVRRMNAIVKWVAFYRYNPQRFCSEYLNISLKLFQKIIIYSMMHNNYFMYLAARGQSKTWLTALFCVVRCILYPKTKIVICSATRTQGNEVISKIMDDFCKNYGWGSDNLNSEISEKSDSINNACIKFRNGSWIKVATSSDNARGMRANILIVDEFRMVDLDIINTVLRRFLTAPRTPAYLNKPEYSHLIERNKEIYMSSCWYKSHWSYEKAKAFFVNMLDDKKKYFICCLPYQISIKEGLLSKEQVEDEMSESDFDEIKFKMEMEALYYGDTDGAFFKFEDISQRRKIKTSYFSPEIYSSKNIKIPPLSRTERRILSVDVALLSSKKRDNDAASIQINSSFQSGNSITGNFVYFENHEGMTTDELGLRIMRLFYEYECTDLVLDVKGLGVGVFDFIIKDQYDPSTGKTYGALTISQDQLKTATNKATIQDYESRCKVKNAKKAIWAMLGSTSLNSEMCVLLRNGLSQGKINLLVSEFEAEEILKDSVKGYSKMSPTEQTKYKASYIQTTAAVMELVKLEHEAKGNVIRVFEKAGARKDRYSSMGYNYFVQTQIERQIKPQNKSIEQMIANLPMKQGVVRSMFD